MAIIDPTVTPIVGDTAPAPFSTTVLTEATIAGSGIFDVLMRANKAHLEEQFKLGRITGPDYATVYLGSLQAVLQTALQFALQQPKVALENELLRQQINNAGLEAKVLIAQECKLRAEFDVLMETKLKTAEEKTLIVWKTTTEKAQTLATGVDADSVIGKQKQLYQAQADGFKRDAEQKAAKVLVDTWNVRRTTDEATSANATNKLDDATVGRAVDKLLVGVGA